MNDYKKQIIITRKTDAFLQGTILERPFIINAQGHPETVHHCVLTTDSFRQQSAYLKLYALLCDIAAREGLEFLEGMILKDCIFPVKIPQKLW